MSDDKPRWTDLNDAEDRSEDYEGDGKALAVLMLLIVFLACILGVIALIQGHV